MTEADVLAHWKKGVKKEIAMKREEGLRIARALKADLLRRVSPFDG